MKLYKNCSNESCWHVHTAQQMLGCLSFLLNLKHFTTWYRVKAINRILHVTTHNIEKYLYFCLSFSKVEKSEIKVLRLQLWIVIVTYFYKSLFTRNFLSIEVSISFFFSFFFFFWVDKIQSWYCESLWATNSIEIEMGTQNTYA